MKPLPKKKKLLLQKAIRERVSKLREMVSALVGPGEMSTSEPETTSIRPHKRKTKEREERRWRRKL